MRLIDADELKESFKLVRELDHFERYQINRIQKKIDQMPTLPNPCGKPCAFERPYGEWITEPHSRIIHCSNCGAEENRNKLYLAKWCYSCGADMRKEGEDNETD